jgi:hypothetical protein
LIKGKRIVENGAEKEGLIRVYTHHCDRKGLVAVAFAVVVKLGPKDVSFGQK